MSVRRYAAALTALALTTALAATMTAAEAEPTFVPATADLVGVGGGETQEALTLLAEGDATTQGWNDTHAAGRIASFDAIGDGLTPQIKLNEAHLPIDRPTDSAAGKRLLYGDDNDTDVDFVRSVTSLSEDEAAAGLRMIPFARDGLGMAFSATLHHAPSYLPGDLLVQVYKGEVTNWNEIGGLDGVIKPLVPPVGSLTRTAFETQLKKLNGGVAVTFGPAVTESPENSDVDIKDDPNAIAPLSLSEAYASETTLMTHGWQGSWPLYNVVRGSAVTRDEFKAVFGPKGFLCTTAARPLIEAAGLKQLARPEHGGVCGVATTEPTTNLDVNQQLVTATEVTGTSPAAGVARLSATVSAFGGVGDPVTGAVEFREGNIIKGSSRVDDDGTATFDVASLSGGDHHFNARLVPDEGSNLEPSISAPVTVLVKRSSFTYITLPASAPTYGQGGDIKVSVSSTVTATGSVSIKVGSAAAKTVPLSAGKASLPISKTLKVGSYPVLVTYPGSTVHASSSKTATLVIKKAKLTATETFPSTVAKGKRANGTVTVKITNSSMIPTGKIVIKRSWKVLAAGWLKNGRVTITLPPLVKGMNQLTINHAGTSNIEPMKKTIFILQMS